jgi:Holliday junction resolvase RusA-like endonuclease
MESVTIRLELPPKELNPNHTVGSTGMRMAKATRIKSYREHACQMAYVGVAATSITEFGWRDAMVEVLWQNEVKGRRPDPDNALAYLKPAFDGLTDSGVLADDRNIVFLPVQFEKVPSGQGGIQLTVTNGNLTQGELHELFSRVFGQRRSA